jgi:hypothetical protein
LEYNRFAVNAPWQALASILSHCERLKNAAAGDNDKENLNLAFLIPSKICETPVFQVLEMLHSVAP